MAGLWDKNFRKRNISIVLCMGLFAGCLSGCGGEYAGVTGGDAASGGAVSGSAVSGSAIGKEQAGDGSGEKEKQDMSGHRFCTDTNLYYEENGAVMQMRLDGTHKTCLKAPGSKYYDINIDYVDENWLYYDQGDTGDRFTLYCAPIRKDADGYDVVSISEEEKVVTDLGMFPTIYVDSRYFIYQNDDDKIVKYDLQKREKEVSTKRLLKNMVGGKGFKVNNHYIVATDDGDILVQDIDAKQWSRVSSFADGIFGGKEEYTTQNEQAVFYPQNLTDDYDDRRFRIRRYDGEKETDFLTWEQIEKTVSEAEDLGPGELDFAIPDYLFWQGDRLYIQVQVGWEKEGIYHEEFMILSRTEGEDGSGLRYEREFTECMRTHIKTRKGKWCVIDNEGREEKPVFKEQMVINDARCIAMVNEKAYLCLYDNEKDEGHLGCYELNTGKFQWVDREDLLFYEIGYDHSLSEFEGVYESYLKNLFMPDWETPSADKDEDGYFMEDAEE